MMWLKLLTALPLAQHEGEGIAKFLPIIIIFGLYLVNFLGKLLQEKNKKTSEQTKPKPTRPMPPQQQSQQPAPPSRVPVYARKMQSPGDQPPPQPARPKLAAPPQRPVPAAQRPRPAMPQPRPPIPPTRVTQPQTVQVPQQPIRIQILPQQPRRISQQKPQKKASQLPSQSVQEKPASSAAQQAKRREKVRTSHQAAQYQPVKKQTTPPASVQFNVPLNRLQTALSQSGELAKAVVYSEILGKPLSLRPDASQPWD